MKIEKFQLRSNNSVCVGAFQLLCGRAPAQLVGNIADKTHIHALSRIQTHNPCKQMATDPHLRLCSHWSQPKFLNTVCIYLLVVGRPVLIHITFWLNNQFCLLLTVNKSLTKLLPERLLVNAPK
jgi:hypothetical protein